MTPKAGITEIPYPGSGERLCAAIAHLPWTVFLDSGAPWRSDGRFDIIATAPTTRLTTRGSETMIEEQQQRRSSEADPFLLLERALGPITQGVDHLPFCGGAIGFFGYDLGRRLERLPQRARPTPPYPEMVFAIYPAAAVVDHQQQRAFIVGRTE
ncbi:MAG: aminodeoxychorismate synthase component I, partial [Gammaproteobacteria bacterium]|nr:aminodeoxychorismate synthase component I [Gammaproteobacteria bacterium]